MIAGLPDALRRSLTWDQGSEMAGHAAFSLATAVDVYFATRTRRGNAAPTRTPTGCCASTSPRAPTSRCTAPTDLAAVAAALNGRPRKTLGWKTPAEALDEFLAAQAA